MRRGDLFKYHDVVRSSLNCVFRSRTLNYTNGPFICPASSPRLWPSQFLLRPALAFCHGRVPECIVSCGWKAFLLLCLLQFGEKDFKQMMDLHHAAIKTRQNNKPLSFNALLMIRKIIACRMPKMGTLGLVQMTKNQL